MWAERETARERERERERPRRLDLRKSFAKIKNMRLSAEKLVDKFKALGY